MSPIASNGMNGTICVALLRGYFNDGLLRDDCHRYPVRARQNAPPPTSAACGFCPECRRTAAAANASRAAIRLTTHAQRGTFKGLSFPCRVLSGPRPSSRHGQSQWMRNMSLSGTPRNGQRYENSAMAKAKLGDRHERQSKLTLTGARHSPHGSVEEGRELR